MDGRRDLSAEKELNQELPSSCFALRATACLSKKAFRVGGGVGTGDGKLGGPEHHERTRILRVGMLSRTLARVTVVCGAGAI